MSDSIQYWDYYATLGVALHRAQVEKCRFRIFKVRVTGAITFEGMWKAVKTDAPPPGLWRSIS